jgi:hypothetical protein
MFYTLAEIDNDKTFDDKVVLLAEIMISMRQRLCKIIINKSIIM